MTWGLFPKKPDRNRFTGAYANRDYSQAVADYDSFYRHLAKSADFTWAKPAAPKLFSYGQNMDFDPSVLSMYKNISPADIGATYGAPAEFPGIASIVNLERKKRYGA